MGCRRAPSRSPHPPRLRRAPDVPAPPPVPGPAAARGARGALPAARAACDEPLRRDRPPAGGPLPGRVPRAGQGGRPVRPRPRRGVLELRGPDDGRRAEAPPARRDVGPPRPARPAGSRAADAADVRGTHAAARAPPDGARARDRARLRRRRGARGAACGVGVSRRLARRPARARRRRSRRPQRAVRLRGAAIRAGRAGRGPLVPGRGARDARARGAPPALRARHDPARDRTRARRLAGACVADRCAARSSICAPSRPPTLPSRPARG